MQSLDDNMKFLLVKTERPSAIRNRALGLQVRVVGCAALLFVLSGCTSPEVSQSKEDASVVPTSDTTVEEKVAVNSSSALVASISAATTSIPAGSPVLIDFKVENTGTEDIKILPWNTPLEERLSADVFTILKDGNKALFIGRKMRRPAPTEADYVNLAPGESLENTVDLALSYNLAKPGTYSVQYTPLEISGVPSFNIDRPVSVDETVLTIELN